MTIETNAIVTATEVNQDFSRVARLAEKKACIVSVMPRGIYEGYSEEIHEVFVYDVTGND